MNTYDETTPDATEEIAEIADEQETETPPLIRDFFDLIHEHQKEYGY